jgi:AAA+ superfamily predicted ATPase
LKIKCAWLDELTAKWQSGVSHAFLITGNVDDQVAPGIFVKDALIASSLLAARDFVAVYNRSNGIAFPVAGHRDKFLDALGIERQTSPALAALREARGQSSDNDGVQLPSDPLGALALLERALTIRKEGEGGPAGAVIIENVETLAPGSDVSAMSPEDRTVLVTLLRWARERAFVNVGSPVFLMAELPGDVNIALRRASSRIESVKVPYPGYQERLDYIEALCKDDSMGDTAYRQRLASLTAALKLVHVEDIFLRAGLDGVTVTDDIVRERKGEIVASEFEDILAVIEPKTSLDMIGGLQHVKEFFIKNVIRPMKDGRLTRVPQGVLLMGPAGTGKTILAEAIAIESGMNCCSLNVGQLLGSYVGSSEKNLERALDCINALAPTIVIVDEIDQMGLGRGSSGDSGVGNRIFRRRLEFMSDTSRRGKIIFLGITNRPDLLDAAFKRPGRFDRKIPILAPGAEEREAILRALCLKYGIECPQDVSEVVAETDGWTGAEMEALVLKAYEVADDAEEAFSVNHLMNALEVYIPTTQGIKEMTDLALSECSDIDLLPPEYRDVARKKRQTPAMQEAEVPVQRGARRII